MATKEVHVRGIKRTITNILVNTDTNFKAYYYNYLLDIKWSKNLKSWMSDINSPTGEVLQSVSYKGMDSFEKTVKTCIELILAHYQRIKA